mgnify:CR=1 FL=1
MKILIVSQYFWPENFKINDLALGLKSGGHKITVLTGIPNYPGGKFFNGYGFFKNRKEYFKGIEIIRAPIFSRGNGSGIRLALNYFSFVVGSILVSKSIIRLNKFEHINFSNILKKEKVYENLETIWKNDQVHLKERDYNIFLKKLLEFVE